MPPQTGAKQILYYRVSPKGFLVMGFISERYGIISLKIYVQPRTSKTEMVGLHDDSLKVRIAGPPVDGAANDELIVFFAKGLGLPKSAVVLRYGENSRRKMVDFYGTTMLNVKNFLGKFCNI